MKKEWLCKDVQAAYSKTDRDPKDIPKTQFGYGLLPCGSDCKRKVQVVESELSQRKPEVAGVTYFILHYRNLYLNTKRMFQFQFLVNAMAHY